MRKKIKNTPAISKSLSTRYKKCIVPDDCLRMKLKVA